MKSTRFGLGHHFATKQQPNCRHRVVFMGPKFAFKIHMAKSSGAVIAVATLLIVGFNLFWDNNQSNITKTAKADSTVVATTSFAYTGSVQTFTAPVAGNYQLQVWGAAGGGPAVVTTARGGYSAGVVSLTAGQVISVYVGGAGTDKTNATIGTVASGGWNGGGSGYSYWTGPSGAELGGGGGATDIRVDGLALSNRVIVAGGGGGISTYCRNVSSTDCNTTTTVLGGGGGGASGISDTNSSPGYRSSGGTQTAGGGGSANAINYSSIISGGSTNGCTSVTMGSLGVGGDGCSIPSSSPCYSDSATNDSLNGGMYNGGLVGAGGGGGYYGGGGGGFCAIASTGGQYRYYSTAGSGGSGYIGGVKTVGNFAATTIAGNASMPSTSGGTQTGQTGNGYAIISQLASLPPTITAASPNSGFTTGGTSVTITGTNLTGTSIAFGGVPCKTLTIVSDTQATCVTPSHPAGAVDIIVGNGVDNATLAGGFTYTVNGGALCMITFNANGGSGTMAPQLVQCGVSTALHVNTFTYAGQHFANWSTAANGNGGTTYADGAAATVTSANITLYARWASGNPTSYNVEFDSNNGSVVTMQTVSAGSVATKPADPTMTGYTFSGWYTDSNCDMNTYTNYPASCVNQYDFSTPVTNSLTLYAKWTVGTQVPILTNDSGLCTGECFAFTIDTRLGFNGSITGTATTFSIPTSGYVGGASNWAYNWTIDWGDGNTQTVSGTSSTTSAGISHNYATAGQYQIAIRPTATAAAGWFNALGFYAPTVTDGANAAANRYMFESIDTPFTDLMRTKGATYRFAFIFCGASNGTEIPSGLFSNVSTAGDANLSYMFYDTFDGYAYSNTNYAYANTTWTIPSGLFDSLNTSSATNFSYMFCNTFYTYANVSTAGTIPKGLFGTIDTTHGTTLIYMFFDTFWGYAKNSTIGTIPADLFAKINTTSAGTNLNNIFYNTFGFYAQRVANFVINGVTVNTQTFNSGDVNTTYGLYSTKVGTTGTPSTNPAVVAGNVAYPTYDATVRTINAPTGTYAGYLWYRTDGTSCAAPSPTSDCGAQNSTTLATFPNTTEWTPTTSTEKGNVTFYGVLQTLVALSVSNDNLSINLAPTSPTGTTTNIISAATNSPAGYTLSIQAGCAFDASGDLAAGTCASDNRLKLIGSAVGSTNSADYLASTAPGALADNTWGYQFDVAGPDDSNWLPVPTTATNLKTTNVANAGSSGLSAGTPNNYNVFYGAKISADRPGGTYRGTIVYTAVGN